MSLVERHHRGPVMTITLADEERRNALSDELLADLLSAIEEANSSESTRVVVVTNRGSVFSAGANLRERSSHDAPVLRLSDLFLAIRHSEKIFVGRINGHCVAGGVGLAAVLDISLASQTATFGFSEVRLGLAPAIISVVCLPKMRLAAAQSAFLRGHRFSASEAAELGLITACAAPESLDAALEETISDLLAGEPHALAVTKELLRTVPTLSLEDAFTWTSEISKSLFASERAREGMNSFFEKRDAPWVAHLEESE
ncbi:MAG TPA: enoyl-CoA hydratase-related protein [Acidimicrobiales bacterium]|jgi:methylglutaconyl-CoA hydratase